MALIHVFNGINKKTTYTFNGRLRDHLQGVDWDNSVILRGGYRISPDYEIKENDIIYVRRTPAAATTVAIVLGVTALVGAGVAVGVAAYQAKKTRAAMEEAARAAKAAAEQSGKLPYIKGARNQTATGYAFPYLIGETLMTPYKLCSGYYSISGDKGQNQFYNVVLEVAYNNILIEKLKLGETVIKDFSGTAEPQNGSYTWDTGVYYDESNAIEIRQTGAFSNTTFNKKIVCTELNTEIPHRHATSDPAENQRIEAEWKAGVVQELPNNAKSVEVIVLFDGLQYYNNGSWQNAGIELQAQWTNVNNPTENDWNTFNFIRSGLNYHPNVFSYNTREQMRFRAVANFTAAQAYGKSIKVRVKRLTPKYESNAKDTVYLMAVQTTCYDPKQSSASSLVDAAIIEENERDKTCRIGIKVKANLNTTGMLDAFNVIGKGCARTWNGTSWSQTKTPTRNLAAWALEILTSPHHKPSQYQDSELDLESFGAWYEYCEEMGFNADGVIVRSTKKQTILETLCRNSNAVLVYNPLTGLMEVAIDNGRDYSVALLNSENIISISTVKKFERKTDGKKVKYINAAAGYDTDSVIFMRDEGEYNPATDTLTETALEYITDYEHAFKYAWRQMAEEQAQPRIVTVKTGLESAYYPIYSRVELQHKSLKIGIAHGVIKGLTWNNSYLQKITLDGSVTFETGKHYGVIINCVSEDGRGLVALKVSGTGKTSELTVDTTLRSNADVIPVIGNILSFGELDEDNEFSLVTSSMKITNAEETDGGFTLTLVDYNPDIYTYGTLPAYKSTLTNRPNNFEQTIEQQREYVTQGEVEGDLSEAVQAAVDTITEGTRFTNVFKVRPVENCLDEIIAKIDDDARNSSASISMSEEEILLQVQNVEKGLVGLIDIQAGAVTALVEGGGATGQMSLTLNLPIMLDADKRAELIEASTEAKVNAVYALVEGTEYYSIKQNASNEAVKALWDDAVAGGLIASQIELQADQIYIEGDVIVNEANKIKAALIDVENLLATTITVKDKGVLKSENFNGNINDNGQITSHGTAGWAIDNSGNAVLNSLYASGSAIFEGGIGKRIVLDQGQTQYTFIASGSYLILCRVIGGVATLSINAQTESNIYIYNSNTVKQSFTPYIYFFGSSAITVVKEDQTLCTATTVHKTTGGNYYELSIQFVKTLGSGDQYEIIILSLGAEYTQFLD